MTHGQIGNMLLAAERLDDSLAEYRKAQTIFEKLAATDPGNTEWQYNLVVSYTPIGDVLTAAGRV